MQWLAKTLVLQLCGFCLAGCRIGPCGCVGQPHATLILCMPVASLQRALTGEEHQNCPGSAAWLKAAKCNNARSPACRKVASPRSKRICIVSIRLPPCHRARTDCTTCGKSCSRRVGCTSLGRDGRIAHAEPHLQGGFEGTPCRCSTAPECVTVTRPGAGSPVRAAQRESWS